MNEEHFGHWRNVIFTCHGIVCSFIMVATALALVAIGGGLGWLWYHWDYPVKAKVAQER